MLDLSLGQRCFLSFYLSPLLLTALQSCFSFGFWVTLTDPPSMAIFLAPDLSQLEECYLVSALCCKQFSCLALTNSPAEIILTTRLCDFPALSLWTMLRLTQESRNLRAKHPFSGVFIQCLRYLTTLIAISSKKKKFYSEELPCYIPL